MPTEDTGSGTPRRSLFRTGAGVGIAALGAAATTTAVATSAFAEEPATTTADPNPAFPKHELRAFWIASVVNIDWPSRTGLDEATGKAELDRWLDDAVSYGLNAVMFQVRPTADAFWPSPYEPWSRWLTGTQGEDPGWDPLGYAVEGAHSRGIELHAWFNPYRVSMPTSTGDVGTDVNGLVDGHIAKENPDWVVAYPPTSSGRLYFNPGIPGVRDHCTEAIMHAVDNYDLDGVHFDDYFYPYPSGGYEFDDAATYEQYGGDFDNIADWRRNNIDMFIENLSRRIKASKPGVKFGVSPFGVWRNIADDPEGSDTAAGAPTYDVLFADTRKWVREEWLDYINPQVYWAFSLTVARYGTIAEWWDGVCAGTNVSCYIGEATYKVNASTQSPEWNNDPYELSNHVAFDREHENIHGNVYFSAKSVRANELNAMGIIRDTHYARPALIPPHEQRMHRPDKPRIHDVRRTESGGVEVRFGCDRHGDGHRDTANWFAVWRFDGRHHHVPRSAFDDATALIGRTHVSSGGTYVDATAEAGKNYTYVVTAYNACWTESRPSRPHTV